MIQQLIFLEKTYLNFLHIFPRFNLLFASKPTFFISIKLSPSNNSVFPINCVNWLPKAVQDNFLYPALVYPLNNPEQICRIFEINVQVK